MGLLPPTTLAVLLLILAATAARLTHPPLPLAASSAVDTEPGPLRVFALVGQSNMVGHGSVSAVDASTGLQLNATLEWLVAHAPDEYGRLKAGGEGAADRPWTVRDDVWVACNSMEIGDVRPVATASGALSPGLCAGGPGQEHRFGPELGFGWRVGDALRGRVLLLKLAWGGRNLSVDFRPPSSGGTTGRYYTSVVDAINSVVANVTQLFPAAGGRPAVLSGFAWHQGWNDGCNDTMIDEYEENLAHLVRDVREDLRAPDLPFVIAASGMKGYDERPDNHREGILEAQLRVAARPAFAGNVASVDTRPFARGAAPASPTDRVYHWMGNAESYWLIGKSLGTAMLGLVERRERGALSTRVAAAA